MDLPTLHELKSLLKEDSVFRDYFNTFLNLPVSKKPIENPESSFGFCRFFAKD